MTKATYEEKVGKFKAEGRAKGWLFPKSRPTPQRSEKTYERLLWAWKFHDHLMKGQAEGHANGAFVPKAALAERDGEDQCFCYSNCDICCYAQDGTWVCGECSGICCGPGNPFPATC